MVYLPITSVFDSTKKRRCSTKPGDLLQEKWECSKSSIWCVYPATGNVLVGSNILHSLLQRVVTPAVTGDCGGYKSSASWGDGDKSGPNCWPASASIRCPGELFKMKLRLLQTQPPCRSRPDWPNSTHHHHPNAIAAALPVPIPILSGPDTCLYESESLLDSHRIDVIWWRSPIRWSGSCQCLVKGS